jgi:hypothetical protein
MRAARRKSTVVRNTVVGLVAAAGLVLSGLVAVSASAATDPSITINKPAQAKAGTVVLSGNVAKGSAGTTTVLYVLDATSSTHLSAGSDCNGDGVHSVADDLNGDGSVGDVLDCEIGAVKKLNASLISSYPGTGMEVGVEAFSHNAAVAALSATPADLFAAPASTGGEAQPRIITATESIWRDGIHQYVPKPLGASPTSYDAAVATALSALHSAPAGPKWVMLLSDGKTSVADSTLRALHSSGIHLSSFAVGTGSTCKSVGALAKMSGATGERCITAPSPANLAASLTNAQPDGIANVSVAIAGTSVAADIDPVGGWRAKFTLGKGSYTAKATATLTSGHKISVSRSFSVSAAAGHGGPKPGTVATGPGALKATAIKANRPAPSRTALPSRVSGTVGKLKHGKLVVTKHLNGAKVLLQGRKAEGGAWVTLDRDKVKSGAYQLHWTPTWSVHLLRVSLKAHGHFAGTSNAVPKARISGCAVTRHATHFSMTCHTTAKTGAKARFYDGGRLVDTAKVAGGLVKVHAAGHPGGHVLVVKHSRKRHAHTSQLAL